MQAESEAKSQHVLGGCLGSCRGLPCVSVTHGGTTSCRLSGSHDAHAYVHLFLAFFILTSHASPFGFLLCLGCLRDIRLRYDMAYRFSLTEQLLAQWAQVQARC